MLYSTERLPKNLVETDGMCQFTILRISVQQQDIFFLDLWLVRLYQQSIYRVIIDIEIYFIISNILYTP